MRFAVLFLLLGACPTSTPWMESTSGGSSEPLAIWVTIPTTEATYVTDQPWVDVAGEYNYFPLGQPGSVRNLTTHSEYLLQLRNGLWQCKGAVSLVPGANQIYVWIGGASASITVVWNP